MFGSISSTTASVDDEAFRQSVSAMATALRGRAEVTRVLIYYDTAMPEMVSRDRHATYAAITLRPPDDDGKRAGRAQLHLRKQ